MNKCFAWQGLRLELSEDWDPVRLEGDFERGHAMIADLEGPRLGIKWQTLPSKRMNSARSVQQALRDEVGALAAEEGMDFAASCAGFIEGKLYTEPNPPGRDVFVTFSGTSRRLVSVVFHIRSSASRDRSQRDEVLQSLRDDVTHEMQVWSVFGLT